MKRTLILIAAVLGGVALPALAFAQTKTVNGCEILPVAGSNYYVKADPTCQFSLTGRDLPGDDTEPSNGANPRFDFADILEPDAPAT